MKQKLMSKYKIITKARPEITVLDYFADARVALCRLGPIIYCLSTDYRLSSRHIFSGLAHCANYVI